MNHSTYASMHVYIHMHVHGIPKQEDPNLTYKGQITNKTWKQRLKSIKLDQDKSILCKQNKETEAKRLD